MKLNTPPDSNGGASAPDESPSSDSSSAALAPAALSFPSPSKGEVAAEIAIEFDILVSQLREAHESLKRELAALAPRCPDADTFMNGCCALTKETRALNTFLLGIQLKIRLGEPL